MPVDASAPAETFRQARLRDGHRYAETRCHRVPRDSLWCHDEKLASRAAIARGRRPSLGTPETSGGFRGERRSASQLARNGLER